MGDGDERVREVHQLTDNIPETGAAPSSQASRQALRATGIIGASSAVNVVIGLLRTKAAALILGPVGIGLVGLFHNLMITVATLAAWGIGNVTTRQIASAGESQAKVAAARRAMALAAAFLALAGAALVFIFKEPLAALLGERRWSGEIGWLAIGVVLLVAASYQNGLLTGLRRIGDVARVSILAAVIGSLLGVGALLIWGEGALLAFVLLSPAATFLVGAFYVARLPQSRATSDIGHGDHWRMLAGLGFALTIGSLAVTAGQLAVRSLVQDRLGPESLGHFQAAWVISANYIGFIMAAMATEYYPRLASIISDPAAARRAVGDQAQLTLLLAGPVLVGFVGLSPWIIPLLFSSEFLPAIGMLRWQILGDLLRLSSWPLGFILLASARGRTFSLVETGSALLFVTLTALLLPAAGLEAAGLAYAATAASNLGAQLILARRSIGFVPTRPVQSAFLVIFAALAITIASALASPAAGIVAALILGPLLLLFAVHRLRFLLPAFDRPKWLASWRGRLD